MTPPVASIRPARHPTARHPTARHQAPWTLADAFAAALTGEGSALAALHAREPVDRRDRFLTLLAIYDLHSAPIETLGDTVRHQNAPAVAELKNRLEMPWLAELEAAWATAGHLAEADTPQRITVAMRAVAAKDRLPAAYKWLARNAGWGEVVHFLALEGGPDGGFDDLIAVCQIGLAGSAKLELGKNFWDEMGTGNPDGVHTVLHERLIEAIDMPRIPREEQPVEALERTALNGLLGTNRWLQPEMIGALGLLELQAGPRCRMVLQAFDRLGAPQDAYPFYVEHAEVDPIHGKDWMEKAIVPLVAERPEWGPRMVKGAWWRSTTNLGFFEEVRRSLVEDGLAD